MIALVFSILLAVAMGVLFYLAQSKVKTEKDRADKNEKDFREASDNLARERDYYALKMRSWFDGSLNEEERERLKTAETKINELAAQSKDPRPEKFRELVRAVEGDGRATKPGARILLADAAGRMTSLKARLEQLEQQFASQLAANQSLNATLEATKKEFANYQAQYNPKTFEAFVAKARKEHADERGKLAEDNRQAAEQHKTQMEEVSKDAQQRTADALKRSEEEQKRAGEKLSQELAKLDEYRKELEQKFQSKQIVQFDEPRGMVVRADASGDKVYINLGSDHRVQPQLSFLVYGRGPGNKPQANPKAKIEVVSVVGNSLSQARVTQVAKPEANRDPALESTDEAFWISDPRQFWRARNYILPGDLLYNPAWDPRQSVHVALAGMFDLDGNGEDDVETLRRLLMDRGTVVDAYLDPREGYRLKGAIGQQTQLLIDGAPPGGKISPRRAGESPNGAGAEAKEPYEAMQDEALRRGIKIVKLREFLTRMGHSDLRLPTARPVAAPASSGNRAVPEPRNGPGKDQ
jgi:hypothetical protein